MLEQFRFFDHIEGDRQYSAEDFAEYFRQLLTDGVLNGGENLQVYFNGADRVARIRPGRAWLRGYFYKLTGELELVLSEAHNTFDRIDRVILRLDTDPATRSIKADILTGSPASDPLAPSLTRNETVYEISLARVLVKANTSTVLSSNVTDERLDASVCGLVNSRVQVDASHMAAKFEDWYAAKTTEWAQEWMEWLSGAQSQGYVPSSLVGEPGGIAELDGTGKVPTDQLPPLDGVAINAGHGLTGGGSLAESRTIKLGEPGTVTAESTNSVTEAGHTHALGISKADIDLGNVTNDRQMPLAGGTFTGKVKAKSDVDYSTQQVRNVAFGTSAPSNAQGENGDIFIVY